MWCIQGEYLRNSHVCQNLSQADTYVSCTYNFGDRCTFGGIGRMGRIYLSSDPIQPRTCTKDYCRWNCWVALGRSPVVLRGCLDHCSSLQKVIICVACSSFLSSFFLCLAKGVLREFKEPRIHTFSAIVSSQNKVLRHDGGQGPSLEVRVFCKKN